MACLLFSSALFNKSFYKRPFVQKKMYELRYWFTDAAHLFLGVTPSSPVSSLPPCELGDARRPEAAESLLLLPDLSEAFLARTA